MIVTAQLNISDHIICRMTHQRLMGGYAESQAYKDPGVRHPIGASRNCQLKYTILQIFSFLYKKLTPFSQTEV